MTVDLVRGSLPFVLGLPLVLTWLTSLVVESLLCSVLTCLSAAFTACVVA